MYKPELIDEEDSETFLGLSNQILYGILGVVACLVIIVVVGICFFVRGTMNKKIDMLTGKTAPIPVKQYDLNQRLDNDTRGNGSDVEMPSTALHRKNKENQNTFVVPPNKAN
jgi:hypothetical protein